MKIQIDTTVRDMTAEEIAEMEEWRRNTTPPDSATNKDYENALSDLGVRFGD